MNTTHVDIMSNDWVARAATFKGRLFLDASGCVQVDTEDHDIKMMFSGPYTGPRGVVVRPEDGRAYLEAVAERLGDGTVLCATGIHDLAHCTYEHAR